MAPTVRLLIKTYLDDVNERRNAQKIQDEFTKLGQKAGMVGAEFTKGIENAVPKVRRAMGQAADSADDYARKVQAANRAVDEHNRLIDRGTALEARHADQRLISGNLTAEAARQEDILAKARTAQAEASARVTESDNKRLEQLGEYSQTIRAATAGERDLKQLRLDGHKREAHALDQELMAVRRLKDEQGADLRDRRRELDALKVHESELAAKTAAEARALTEIQAAQKRSAEALNDTEKELGRTRDASARKDEERIRLDEDAIRSDRKREESIRRLTEARVAEQNVGRDSDRRGGGRGGSGGSTIGGILTSIPFVPGGKAGAAIGIPLILTMSSLAEAAVTASQAIALLPAVATAAGAAFGTLELATAGFGDALKHMGDPKKWAEDVAGLSPAAQQAALEIKYLVDGPLKGLKDATQDKLFGGVAEQLHNLTNEFLPEIQQLTTGIAGSFNQMFMGLTNQLMTPESQASISKIINDIVTAFQNLAPAVGPVVDAFMRLTEVGASFLPGLATGLTNAAVAFDKFITNAQQDGTLRNFIQKGIDAAKELFSFIGDIGKKIYEVFGDKSPDEFRATLDGALAALTGIAQAITAIGSVANSVIGFLTPIADTMGGWESLIKTAGLAFVAWNVAGGAISIVTKLGLALGVGGGGIVGALGAIPLAATAVAGALAISFGAAMDGFEKLDEAKKKLAEKGAPQSPIIPTQIQGPGIPLTMPNLPALPGSSPGAPGGNPLTAFAPTVAPLGPTVDYKSLYPAAPTPAPPMYDPFQPDKPLPVAPPEGGKSGALADAKSKLNPANFGRDIGGSMPTMAPGSGPSGTLGTPGDLPPLQYGTNGKPYDKPGLGYNQVDQEKLLNKQDELKRDNWALIDAQMDLEALKMTGLGTAKELFDAQNKVEAANMAINRDLREKSEIERGKWNDVKTGKNGQLGPGLDPDMGLSNGLSGFVDNLIRAMGTAIMGPTLAGLQQTIDADPIKGGYGMFGIMGAQNIANGLSPILGRPYPGGPGSAGGPGMPGSPGGGYPGDAGLLSQIPQSGRYSQEAGRDLLKGVTDCSSAVGDLVSILDTGTTSPNKMSTGNATEWLTAHGFVPGIGGAGDFRVGYNSGHMQATLPGGTPVNYGNPDGYTNAGVGGQGADDPSFTSHWYRPITGSPGMPVGPGSPASVAGGGPGGVQSVYVVNMPGGGPAAPGPGAPPGTGTPSPGTPAAPAAVNPGLAPPPGTGSALPGVNDPNSPMYNPGAAATDEYNRMMRDGTGIFAPANTNPGLNSPPAPAGGPPGSGLGDLFQPALGGPGIGPAGTGPSLSPVPVGGGGGQSPILYGPAGGGPFNAGPGAAGPQGPIGGAPPAPERQSGDGGWQPSGPGAGADGGALGGVAAAAGSALDAIAPGAGQAAQTATKLINRSIQFGGQLASIGVEGLMQTFLPGGGGALGDPSKSWAGRLLGGLAQAKPATPTTAGQAKGADPGPQQQGPQYNGVIINGDVNHAPRDPQEGMKLNDLAFNAQAAYQPR